MKNNAWNEIPTTEDTPSIRNGHSLVSYDDFLVLFAGIHDLTHEKNDLYIFSHSKQQWIQLQENQILAEEGEALFLYKEPA